MPDMFDLAENVAKAEYHLDVIYLTLKAQWDNHGCFPPPDHTAGDFVYAYEDYVEAKRAYQAAYEESKK